MTQPALAVTWGSNIRRLRSEQGLTQKELADNCSVAQHTISRIETGVHRPNDDLRIKLAAALGSTVEALFPFPATPATSPAQRRSYSRIGAYVTNSRYDTRSNTQKARDAAFEYWVRQVDPDGSLPRAEQVRRATSARRAHLSRIARLSHEARRRNKAASTA